MKHLHPAVTGRAELANEPHWPELPWTCPRCHRKFESHFFTVATMGKDAHGSSATFYCAPCDVIVFSRNQDRN